MERKNCDRCKEALDFIWFTALVTEEWSWNGVGYNECTARHSLITDPEQPVICPNCGNVVGTGQEFGFGGGGHGRNRFFGNSKQKQNFL